MNQRNLFTRLLALVMVMTGARALQAQDAYGTEGLSADQEILMIYDADILANPALSPGEKNAYEYFKDRYAAPAGFAKNILTTKSEDIKKYPTNPSKVKCIWIHIDRDKNTPGWRKLPEAYTNPSLIHTLRDYMLNGGNLYLSGQATELVVPLWRVNTAYAINQVEQGGGEVKDIWKITVKLNSGRNGGDNSDHAIFNGLVEGENKEISLFGNAHTNDRSAKWKLWDGDRALFDFRWNNETEDATMVERFEYDNLATVLASYNWDKNGQYAAMVELHPLFTFNYEKHDFSRKSGTIITNSIGAYDFSAGAANSCQGNLEKLTGNILTYLSGETKVCDQPYPYYYPAQDGLEEIIESTGRIAMYIDCTREEWERRCTLKYEEAKGYHRVGDLVYEQEIAAYNYFLQNFVNLRNESNEPKYPGAAVVFSDKMDRLVFSETDGEGFECIWVNCDRDGLYESDENRDGHMGTANFDNLKRIFYMGEVENGEHELISKIKAFTNAGGNLYLTKWANLMLGALGRTEFMPNQVTALAKTDQTDHWGLNVLDQTGHPIYQYMDKDGSKIWLQSGTTDRQDHNCVWDLRGIDPKSNCNYDEMDNESARQHYNYTHNARVLGTWGHDEDYATKVPVIVEFYPVRSRWTKPGQTTDGPQRVTSKEVVMQRRGTAIANGVGAYTWSGTSIENDQNRNVSRLTTSILEYLTPVMANDIYTGVSGVENSDDQKPVYYNLQGLRVDNPSGGIFIEVRGTRTRKVML